jgi:glycosyltransferase involved in cell wall biosynthesis
MKKTILILPYSELFPMVNGGMLRFINVLNQLSKYTSLTVLTFANSTEIVKLTDEFPNLKNMNFISVSNEAQTPIPFLPKKIAVAIYGRILSGRMFNQSNGVLLSMFPKLNSLLNNNQFDIVIYENLATLDIARKIKVNYPNTIQVYDAHNFDTEIAFNEYERNEIPKGNYFNIKKTEAELYKFIDILWTCSDREKMLFLEANNNRISKIDVIPNGAALTEIKPVSYQKITNKLLFVGSLNYSPNDLGLQWFINSVLSKITQKYKLQIIGSGSPSIELVGLVNNSPNIQFIGFVESLGPYYANSDIVVIPILTGSGTRLKALEAMSHQCAIISTSKGVEGLEITDQVIIQDTPIEFAKSIDQILIDVDLKKSLGQKARKLVEDNYSWEIIGEKIFNSIN